MSSLINYDVTRANALKNWDLMTRATPKHLSVKKYFRFWLFHEMFMNRIKNIGWFTYLVFTYSGINNIIAKDLFPVKLEMIETEYQAPKISISPNDSITKLKYCGLYTWLFNSSEKSAQNFPAE